MLSNMITKTKIERCCSEGVAKRGVGLRDGLLFVQFAFHVVEETGDVVAEMPVADFHHFVVVGAYGAAFEEAVEDFPLDGGGDAVVELFFDEADHVVGDVAAHVEAFVDDVL